MPGTPFRVLATRVGWQRLSLGTTPALLVKALRFAAQAVRRSPLAASLPIFTLLFGCPGGAPSVVATGAGQLDGSIDGGIQHDAPAASSTILSLSDSGTAATLQPLDTLVIKLRSRTGTGYVWELKSVDRSILDLAGPPTIERDGGAEGAVVNHVFSFVAKRTGATHLEIAFRRPWESAPPERTFALDVTVK